MLAAAAFPALSTTLTCRRHAMCPPIVSAKIPRRKNDHVAPRDEQMGALSTLKSSNSYNTPNKQNNNNRPMEEKGPSPAPAPLSGSDVLLALQRAAAEKARRDAETRKGRKGKRVGSTTRRVEQAPSAAASDCNEVRPLNIRSDWAARLDEMERLLQDLQMQEEKEARRC